MAAASVLCVGYRWFASYANTPPTTGAPICVMGPRLKGPSVTLYLYWAQLPGGTVTNWLREVTDERGQPDLPSALLPKEGLKHYAEEIGSAGRRTLPEVYEQPTYRPYQVSARELCANARARYRALSCRHNGPSPAP